MTSKVQQETLGDGLDDRKGGSQNKVCDFFLVILLWLFLNSISENNNTNHKEEKQYLCFLTDLFFLFPFR